MHHTHAIQYGESPMRLSAKDRQVIDRWCDRNNTMNRLCQALLLAVIILSAAACATGNSAALQQRIQMLEGQLAVEKAEKEDLQTQLQTLREITHTLEKEKGVRVEETAAVRSQIRSFVQLQVETLRDFSQNTELMDYVGAEILSRSKTGGNNLLLVDLQNSFKENTTVISGRLYGKSDTKAVFCLLRPQGDTLDVIWMSKVFNIPTEGVFKVSFDTPVTAKMNDIIGLYCPGVVGIPYDIGTGDTRSIQGPVDTGMKIRIDSLDGKQKRAYSFGINGFFN